MRTLVYVGALLVVMPFALGFLTAFLLPPPVLVGGCPRSKG